MQHKKRSIMPHYFSQRAEIAHPNQIHETACAAIALIFCIIFETYISRQATCQGRQDDF